jgi:Reverse transcriptase (RNA-dependent DNA polymerase)
METFSRWFKIGRGIKQGDPFSPKAFNSALQKVFSKINWENRGINIGSSVLSELRFADDVAVLAENENDLISMMSDVFRESESAGLYPNASKTKIITNTEIKEAVVNGTKFDVVKDYVYLGQITSFENSQEKQVEARISSAWKAYWSLKKFFKSHLPMYHKQRLFDACVLPVFTYGCQTWSLNDSYKEKLAVAQRSMERSMMNVRRKDKVKNQKIRRSTQLKDVSMAVRELKWRWAGHVARYPIDRLPNQVETWIPEGKRSKGRPKTRWKDEIVEHSSIFWRRKAQSRKKWQDMGTSFIRI